MPTKIIPYRIQHWALAQPIKPSTRKLVLVALAIHADRDALAFPSQKLLASEVGCEERQLRTHLTALEDAGYFVRRGRWRVRMATGRVMNT
jgi:predicted ArsR family transcriptional regulator